MAVTCVWHNTPPSCSEQQKIPATLTRAFDDVASHYWKLFYNEVFYGVHTSRFIHVPRSAQNTAKR